MLDFFEKFIQKVNARRAERLYSLGANLQDQARWSEAARSYKKAIKIDSSKGNYFYSLGCVLQRMSEWNEANTCYRNALERDETKALWHYKLGYTFQKLNDWKEANKSYINATKINSSKALWHYRLGYSFQKLSDWKDASKSYISAIKIDAKNALWHYRLGYSLQKIKSWNEAIVAYKTAIQIDPSKLSWQHKLSSLENSVNSEIGLVEEFGKDIIRGWVVPVNEEENILVKVNGVVVDQVFPGRDSLRKGGVIKTVGFARTLSDLWKYIGPKDKVEFEYGGETLPIAGIGLAYSRSSKSKKLSRVDELITKIEEGFVFNKYGRLKLSIANDQIWKESIFNLFNCLKKDLKAEFNLDLFPTYGTMLGAVREGDFISHDNDFDTSYISRETTPEKVKNEFLEICNFLINKGYKLHVKDTHTWVYVENKISFYFKLDIFVTYFNEKGYYEVTYGYHGPALKKTSEFFEFSEINLSDYQIEVPVNYRDILKQLYGKNWEVPDPGFKHDEDTRQWDKKYHLDLKQVSALYWKQFYNKRNIQNHSRFASFVNDFISSKSNIVEIGCGSGEDALFFESNGHVVSACDQCNEAFKKADQMSGIKFAAVDAGDSNKLNNFLNESFSMRGMTVDGDNMLYMRFFLHSITKEIENIILETASSVMKKDDLLAAEFRTEKDQDANHTFKKHYRRFIPMAEMIAELKKYGFEVIHSQESQGLSPFGNEDPFLCRIVAKKIK